jgi:SpoVK/Ycf46/Vps4 family AAA+-type ATPase
MAGRRHSRIRRIAQNDPHGFVLIIDWLLRQFEKNGEFTMEETKLVSTFLSEDQKSTIAELIQEEICRYRKEVNESLKYIPGISEEYNFVFSDILFSLWKDISPLRKRGTLRNRLEEEIRKILIAKLEEKKNLDSREIFRLQTIAEVFRLDEDTMKVLEFKYYADCLNICKISQALPDENIFMKAASFIGITTGRVFDAGRKLNRIGLIDDSCGFSLGDLSETISLFLQSDNPDAKLTGDFLEIADTSAAMPLRNFSIEKEETRIVRDLLSAQDCPAHLLFYGEPGTGKSQYTKAILRATGRKAVYLKKDYERSDTANNRMLQLIAASNFAAREYVIVIDEADSFLNSERKSEKAADKGSINDFFDTTECTTIWITNSLNETPDSIRRRFHYSLKFDHFGEKERRNAWKIQLAESPVKSVVAISDVEKIASRYETNAAGAAIAVKVLETCFAKKLGTRAEAKIILEKTLERHLEVTGGKRPDKHGKSKGGLKPLGKNYSLEFLNTDPEPRTLLNAVQGSLRALKNSETSIGLNLLFWGLSGAGKTEFVKFLARETKKKLMFQRCSDLESPYVGQTEQNLAEAFRFAEKDEAILFLDEADSFLTRREGASRSWEISRTNELLTQMENFSGIFVCSTNLPDLLDTAVIRRFAWKVEFRAVKREKRLELYRAFFRTVRKPISPEETARVESLEGLTPGDCAAIQARFEFVEPEKRTHEAIIRALVAECAWKNKGVGKAVGF